MRKGVGARKKDYGVGGGEKVQGELFTEPKVIGCNKM